MASEYKPQNNEVNLSMRTEEFFLIMLNRNDIDRMPEFLHLDVVFPRGKGKANCLKWIRKELDKIYLFRLQNKGYINGKMFDPFFDDDGHVIEFYISTAENAGNRAIPIQDFAFPFIKDFEPPHAITLSIKEGLIIKIEITYNFVTFKEFQHQLKNN